MSLSGTCIPWCLGWQSSCWTENIVVQGRLSHFLVICSSCHSLVQNSFILFTCLALKERFKAFDALCVPSLCLDRDLCILWDSNGHAPEKYCTVGRLHSNEKGMPWLLGGEDKRNRMGNTSENTIWGLLFSSDRFWFLYPPLFDKRKACQWGWSQWHRSLHILVVPLNYSSCSCDNIVIRRSLIEFTVWLWPIGR